MRKAFTLLELLVAITILIVGILGVTQMVSQGMTYNVEMRQLLQARHIMERRMENFEIIPITDPWLVDPENGSVIDFADTLPMPVDHHDSLIVDNIAFHRYWNVVKGHRADSTDNRFRTARVFVEWVTTKTHRISSDYIRWEER